MHLLHSFIVCIGLMPKKKQDCSGQTSAVNCCVFYNENVCSAFKDLITLTLERELRRSVAPTSFHWNWMQQKWWIVGPLENSMMHRPYTSHTHTKVTDQLWFLRCPIALLWSRYSLKVWKFHYRKIECEDILNILHYA